MKQRYFPAKGITEKTLKSLFGGTPQQVNELHDFMNDLNGENNSKFQMIQNRKDSRFGEFIPNSNYWDKVVNLIKDMGNTPEDQSRYSEYDFSVPDFICLDIEGLNYPYELTYVSSDEPIWCGQDGYLVVGEHCVSMMFLNKKNELVSVTFTFVREFDWDEETRIDDTTVYFVIEKLNEHNTFASGISCPLLFFYDPKTGEYAGNPRNRTKLFDNPVYTSLYKDFSELKPYFWDVQKPLEICDIPF